MSEELLKLAHLIGAEDTLAILGEGNVSSKIGDNLIAVKSSGTCLHNLTEEDITICYHDKLLSFAASSEKIDNLNLAKKYKNQKKPSIESLFHAWLLNFEHINFVAHCHPIYTNQILCSKEAYNFASKRMFPDQVVYCGRKSALVPYADPGFDLLKKIKKYVNKFIEENNFFPNLILLENHGIISCGKRLEDVFSCISMCEKSAQIFIGAFSLGCVNFLNQGEVKKIDLSVDEFYRLSVLKIGEK